MRARITVAVLIAVTACRIPCSQGPPPLIVGPVAVIADGAKVTVKWYTDRPATTLLEYGATTQYGATYQATDLATEHLAVPSGLVPGTTYHFRVRSEDKCGFEVASEDDTFTVPGEADSGGGGDGGSGGFAPPLDPPALVAVADGSAVGNTQVSLAWSAVTTAGGATAYSWVQVNDDPVFSSLLVESGWMTGHEWTLTVQAGKTWYWRVRGQDPSDPQNVSAWSEADSFFIEDTAALPAPVPIAVPDFVTGGMGGPVTFEWKPVEDPDGHPVQYRVQVSWSPDLSQMQAQSGWIKDTQWITNLGAVGTWYWRVQARDAKHKDEVSAWTPVQSFYDIVEIQMKGSCPFVFVRGASGWEYQTEIQGPAIGLPQSVLTTQSIRLYHPEHVVLSGMQKDGAGDWWVKLRETQKEITYLDRLTLLVVDHPPGLAVVASTAESTYSYGYGERFEIMTTGPAARPPVFAKDTTGKDVLASLAEVDGDAYTSTHPTRLVLDFGTLERPEHARLVVTGWSAYDKDAYPSKDLVQPFVEVRDAKGKWVKARSFGNPAGDTKTMAIDLSGLFPTDDHRIRIDMGTVHAIRWAMDRVLVDDSPPVPVVVSVVEANFASLYHAGRAPHSRATHEHPNVVEDGSIADNKEALGWGAFTRYGDVLDLIGAADDMYVIMRHGDGLEISFPDLPPPAPGFHRSLVLEAVLWYKHL
ncbi:MAG: fibronectin type III domain-containing protein, partial [Deltaproteobacteria bacterium]|nr:fibronectin type III domain-containing protein [Deltaproteobacteria bacterium]